MFQVEILHYHRFNIGGVDKTDILCQLCPLATIIKLQLCLPPQNVKTEIHKSVPYDPPSPKSKNMQYHPITLTTNQQSKHSKQSGLLNEQKQKSKHPSNMNCQKPPKQSPGIPYIQAILDPPPDFQVARVLHTGSTRGIPPVGEIIYYLCLWFHEAGFMNLLRMDRDSKRKTPTRLTARRGSADYV